MTDTTTTEEVTFCAVHPDRETGLRCNRCGRYMCAQCAVPTPIGYRCKECVREVEDRFFSATNTDYLIAGAISLVATAAVTFLGAQIGILGFWLIGFFAGVVYGGILSQLLLTVLQKRRGRYTGLVASAAIVVGAAAVLLLTGRLVNLGIWLFAGVTVSVVYGRFR
ncbi:MAG: hypothetical protein IPK52_07920 [Chloroflexi bacterium]|nr:hypothetical protein [Chloroflexota bacterium]